MNCDEYRFCIGYGYSYEEAEEIRKLSLQAVAAYGIKDIPIYQIGVTIGIHTGPYPLGYGILKRAACR